jgi:hypothetical protein
MLAGPHHVDVVGHDVVEEALIVRDEEDAESTLAPARMALTPSATMRSASMSRPESVSSMRAILGSSMAIWRISQRFFSPPEKPSLTAREVNFRSILSTVHLGVEALVVGGGVELLALGQAGLHGGAEEVGDGDAGDLAGVLECEEEAGAGALVGLHREDGLAVEQHITLRDGVVGVAGDGLGEGALAGAVGSHDGVHFAAA